MVGFIKNETIAKKVVKVADFMLFPISAFLFGIIGNLCLLLRLYYDQKKIKKSV
jgi:hypothetical protein